MNGLYLIFCLPKSQNQAFQSNNFQFVEHMKIPEFQGKGIGTKTVKLVMSYYDDREKLTLVTPADKEENIKFYAEKCGFAIESVKWIEVLNWFDLF